MGTPEQVKIVELKGPLFEMSPAEWGDQISIATEGILQACGARLVEKMREQTRPFDFKGRLTSSIMWRTQKRHSKVNDWGDTIDEPDVALPSVDIGSAAPHAGTREHGAGIHLKKEGSIDFLNNLRQWMQARMGAFDEGAYWALVNKIRKGEKAQTHTQGIQPFVAPVNPLVEPIAQQEAKAELKKMFNALRARYPV